MSLNHRSAVGLNLACTRKQTYCAHFDFCRSPNQPNMYSPALRRYVQAMISCSVVLDLDGTLIDSQPGLAASCLAALRALGHGPGEPLAINRIIRRPLEDM